MPKTPCTRRDFLKTLGTAAATAGLPAWSCASHGKPLNFVFFLVDDMGWRDAGCFGSTFYETPNIDRLAAEGMRFTDAYAACPVCSPTRASIMTGKYPARVKITNYIPGNLAAKLLPPPYLHQLPLSEITLGEELRQAGYTTCFTGKWHLGGKGFYPEDQGFDINNGGCEYGHPPSYFYPYSRMYGEELRRLPLTGGAGGEYLTERLVDESIRFLHSNGTHPFLLYHSFYAVHTPLQAKADLIRKYETKAAGQPQSTSPRNLPEGPRETRQVQDHPTYAAMMEHMDTAVGKILDTLDELKISDNTAIIFMSDNGGLSTSEGSPTSNLPLRAGKGWLYEGGIREPLIIKWPGKTAPGSVCNEPVISTDFYPTMLDMAGLPLKSEQHADGHSLAPLLTQQHAMHRDAIYWHYPHYSPQGGTPSNAVRAGDFKLIEFFEDNRLELFNLKEDIGEQHNLAESMPKKAAEMRAMLHRWRTSVDAAMPTSNPDFDPVAEEEFHRRQRDRSRQ